MNIFRRLRANKASNGAATESSATTDAPKDEASGLNGDNGAPVTGLLLDPSGFNVINRRRGGVMLSNRFDVYLGRSFQTYGEFSHGETLLFEKIVQPNMVVFDIGANIGAHTLDFARLVGARGFVYAFEPQRIVFQTLCANLALNQITNVSARQVAVGEAPGFTLVPDFNPASHANFGGVALGEYSHGEQVPIVTLDDMKLERCDFLKIDVEGMEAGVLRGGRETIIKHKPVLFVENDRKEKSAELINLISDLQYDLYWHIAALFNPDNYYGNPKNIFFGEGSVNMLCLPAGSKMHDESMIRVLSPDETHESALQKYALMRPR